MKAKEYFDNYGPMIMFTNEKESDKHLKGLLLDMNTEALELIKKRGAKKNEAAAAILKEQNDKWNAVGRLFKKTYGYDPLAEDGFKDFWINRQPELARYLK